jgi:hypothetical protein
MTMIKPIAALATLSLAVAPVGAQAARIGAPVDDAESLSGGASIAWLFAAIMVVGAVWAIVDDDDGNDLPVSP